MARRHDPKSRIFKTPVRIPEPLEDGKVRCNGCSKVMKPTPNGHLPAHKAPSGEPCAYRASYAGPTGIEAPPVYIPPPPQPPNRISVAKRAQKPSDVDVDVDARLSQRRNACVDCGKWLPGERTVCGRCAIKRNRDRRPRGKKS